MNTVTVPITTQLLKKISDARILLLKNLNSNTDIFHENTGLDFNDAKKLVRKINYKIEYTNNKRIDQFGRINLFE